MIGAVEISCIFSVVWSSLGYRLVREVRGIRSDVAVEPKESDRRTPLR